MGQSSNVPITMHEHERLEGSNLPGGHRAAVNPTAGNLPEGTVTTVQPLLLINGCDQLVVGMAVGTWG